MIFFFPFFLFFTTKSNLDEINFDFDGRGGMTRGEGKNGLAAIIFFFFFFISVGGREEGSKVSDDKF